MSIPPKAITDALHEMLREDAGVQGPVFKRRQQEFEAPREFCHLCWRMVPTAECIDEVCVECQVAYEDMLK